VAETQLLVMVVQVEAVTVRLILMQLLELPTQVVAAVVFGIPMLLLVTAALVSLSLDT
jgi:hypothetical protein